MKHLSAAVAAFFALSLAGCGSGLTGPSAPSNASVPQQSAVATAGVPAAVEPDAHAAAAYCSQTHGKVEVRQPVYGSNSSNLLFLSGKRSFCRYSRGKGSYKSSIYILLATLYTTKPSLAALAYYLKPPTGSCSGNPASCYCTLLGGSDQFGGTTGAGGGWYKKNSVDQTLEACIFPDMSSIDSWGLAYNANGIIRGIDLTKVMRYKYPAS
ncbi:MAG: hypothetical protein WB609_04870 [Candidatus Cybelea sp.]